MLLAAFSPVPGISVTARAAESAEMTEALATDKVDIVLIDSDMSSSCSDTVRLLTLLRQNSPKTKAIVLAGNRTRENVIQYFQNGAKGVFENDGSNFDLLCKCIRRVQEGQIWASSEDLGWIVDTLALSTVQDNAEMRIVGAGGKKLLSKREEDVVALLRNGLSNREIAQELKLSEHTIKNYLFRIFDKLGVSSRTELLLYVMNFKSSDAAGEDGE